MEELLSRIREKFPEEIPFMKNKDNWKIGFSMDVERILGIVLSIVMLKLKLRTELPGRVKEGWRWKQVLCKAVVLSVLLLLFMCLGVLCHIYVHYVCTMHYTAAHLWNHWSLQLMQYYKLKYDYDNLQLWYFITLLLTLYKIQCNII